MLCGFPWCSPGFSSQFRTFKLRKLLHQLAQPLDLVSGLVQKFGVCEVWHTCIGRVAQPLNDVGHGILVNSHRTGTAMTAPKIAAKIAISINKSILVLPQ